MEEYTIATIGETFKTEDFQEAQEYWEELSEEDKEDAEYFKKTWKKFGGMWVETDYEILN